MARLVGADHCRKCGHDKSMAMDSRQRKGTRVRRRECMKCKHRWTTMEVQVEEVEGKAKDIVDELDKIQHLVESVRSRLLRTRAAGTLIEEM